ncbi:MAG TPA: hypothetical protein V6C97_12125 [Oculatellaceae cyanobacterium]
MSRLPKALGLFVCMHAVEDFIRNSPSDVYKRHFLEEPGPARIQLGIYPIYDYALDENDGAVYLVTTVYQDYINVALDGFAYKPSFERRYKGRVAREFVRLWGDWYAFHELEFF